MLDRACILYVYIMSIMISIVCAAEFMIKVNYDIEPYKLLQVNQTLELICRNKLKRDSPSWTYSSRLYRDPRMKLSAGVGESRLVINNAQAEDAGQYRCSIEHEYGGKTFHFMNEIKDVKVEEKKDSIKLLCDVHAFPSPTVTWKIDYDNKTLNPKPVDPGEEDYWMPPDEKVVITKSEGRYTLRPYKGVNNAELIIDDVTSNDNGKYTCVAKNLAGERFKDCTVRVKRAEKLTTASLDNSNVAETDTENSPEEKSSTPTLDNSNVAETDTENSQEGLGGGTFALTVLASIVILGCVLGTVIHELRQIEDVFPRSKFRNSEKKITFLLTSLLFILPIVIAADHEIEVNYNIGHYKLLHVNQTLEIICKNLLNRSPPSWTYPSRLYRDPRMKLTQYVGESRLVISNAQAEDAGQYRCSIDHEFNGKTFHYNRTIEVIVNEIKDVKVEEEKDSIKLLCNVQAYPSATITWKIDYDNKELNTQPEEPDLEDEYWVPPSDDYYRVVVDKTEGRFTLRPYKGVNNAELIITDVTEDDIGKYYCFARNLAGEICKECNVTRPKRGVAVEGKLTTATLGNSNVAETDTDNSQKVEGLGGGTITLIVLSSIVILGSAVGASITLYRKKLHQKQEQEIKEIQEEGRSLPLIECNGV